MANARIARVFFVRPEANLLARSRFGKRKARDALNFQSYCVDVIFLVTGTLLHRTELKSSSDQTDGMMVTAAGITSDLKAIWRQRRSGKR